MTPSLFHKQWTWEYDQWEYDWGMTLNLFRWGFGVAIDYFGSDAPNGITINLGPFSTWFVIWRWTHGRID